MTNEEIQRLAIEARALADSLFASIRDTTTRAEHIRATRQAIEASRIAAMLEYKLIPRPESPAETDGFVTLDFPTV